jgi:hypothetical protein
MVGPRNDQSRPPLGRGIEGCPLRATVLYGNLAAAPITGLQQAVLLARPAVLSAIAASDKDSLPHLRNRALSDVAALCTASRPSGVSNTTKITASIPANPAMRAHLRRQPLVDARRPLLSCAAIARRTPAQSGRAEDRTLTLRLRQLHRVFSGQSTRQRGLTRLAKHRVLPRVCGFPVVFLTSSS